MSAPQIPDDVIGLAYFVAEAVERSVDGLTVERFSTGRTGSAYRLVFLGPAGRVGLGPFGFDGWPMIEGRTALFLDDGADRFAYAWRDRIPLDEFTETGGLIHAEQLAEAIAPRVLAALGVDR